MKRTASWLALFVVAGCLAIPLTVRAADDADRSKTMIEIFDALGYDQIIVQTAAVVGQQIAADIKRRVPNIDPAALAEIEKITSEEFAGLRPEIMAFTGSFMTREFTDSELQDLLAFYRTPAGRKSVTIMPKMMPEMMAWMPSVLQTFVLRAKERIEQTLRSKGYQL